MVAGTTSSTVSFGLAAFLGFATGPEARDSQSIFTPSSVPNSKFGMMLAASGPVSAVTASKKVGSGFSVFACKDILSAVLSVRVNFFAAQG